jgi:hypothetical protein
VTAPIIRTFLLLLLAAVVAVCAALPVAALESAPPPEPPSNRWLASVNYYRATANLPRVSVDSALSRGAQKHAEYMVRNDYIGHSEDPGKPGYSVLGNQAAAHSNVAGWWGGEPTARQFVEMWMTGPFHAVGILRPNLRSVGFGVAHDNSGLTSAAALDVIHGLNFDATPLRKPIVWPGDGTTQPLGRYTGGEFPDPLSSCRGYSAPSGVPIVVQFTEPVRDSSFTLETKDGRSLPACGVDATSYRNGNNAAEDLGRALLKGDNVVLVIPKDPLEPGMGYVVKVTSGRESTTSNFKISP